MHAVIGETKVSLLAYDYPLLFELADLSGTLIADARDIACMKLSAVASRGTKRDFVDLYVAARQFGLQELIDLFQQKYSQVRYNGVHLLKSLGYFADADVEPMPDMLIPLEWEAVKSYFQTEVTRLL